MTGRTKTIGDVLLLLGGVFIILEIVEIISGIPYFGNIDSLGMIFFLGGIAIKEENRLNTRR
jgi:hypothetical protein